jgi:putative hydrolase of HD superfamily
MEGIATITRSLIERVFSAASIERWNDHPHPSSFSELGKQAHKMVIAYVLARREIDLGHGPIDWTELIEGGIFEFLHRVLLTDIKPPVFHRFMEDREQRRKLNVWVASQYRPDLEYLPGGLSGRFERYILSDATSPERRILRAAHYLATKWEFDFVYEWSRRMYRIEETRKEIYSQVEDLADIPSVREILTAWEAPDDQKGVLGFVSLVGQLGFQKRWAQTPRIPQTSVLGHLLFVAILSYLVALEIGACPRRAYNDFFGGLFHDLPEVLTRDIISPVKNSVEGFDDMIRRYERKAMEGKIYPLLPESWIAEIAYFTEDEFRNKIWPESDAMPTVFADADMSGDHNNPESNPLDGRVIEACDKLAAYIEASLSIRLGITSSALVEGREKIYQRFNRYTLSGFHMGTLFDYFR